MKAKELKKILDTVDDNATVCADSSFWNSEVNGYFITDKGDVMLTTLFIQPRII